MAPQRKNDVQAQRDIRRAHLLIGRLRGLSADDSAAALSDHAALTGVSVHVAALALLAEWHPIGRWRGRTPSAEFSATSDRTGRIVLRWRGREAAHVTISGLRSRELATRLQRVLDRAIRSGALHITIDTRRTTGLAPEFDDVITRAGRRLWARRGSLIVRAGHAGHDESAPT